MIDRMTLSGLLLFAISLMLSVPGLAQHTEHAHATAHHDLIEVFVGNTQPAAQLQAQVTLGIEVEHRLPSTHDHLALGCQVETESSRDPSQHSRIWMAVPTVDWYPWVHGLKLFTGAGMAWDHSHTSACLRAGAGYEWTLGEHLVFTPLVCLESMWAATYLNYGLSFGWGF